jgi:ATP-dependent DNA helicase RecG
LESQNVEWKEKWRDEYLKWISAFANAQGGVLVIGKNDIGEPVGLEDTAKLMDDLPNKIRNLTGVIADVDLNDNGEKQYICITVKPYPYPISYHGKYYYRSGSTTQELSGSALDEFMLRKQGKTWDGVPVPYVKVDDFESDAFKIFRRKAVESTRLKAEDLRITDDVLLGQLQLIEGDYLKRAAILLFHQDPEKWVPGAYVKIGMFASDTDLLFQHEFHGPLISMADKIMEAAYLNYFKGIISYDGIQRVETFPVPHEAFREAVTNAIVHRDYSTGIPIQIKVFSDKVIIYNDGRLPENWSVQNLLTTHRSEPYNPMIANVFFRAGMIESWGRGIEKITDACRSAGLEEPAIEFKHRREFSVTFYSDAGIAVKDTIKDTIRDTIKDTINSQTSDVHSRLMVIMSENPRITVKGIAAALRINERNVKKHIRVLKELGRIERIGANRGGHWVVKFPD